MSHCCLMLILGIYVSLFLSVDVVVDCKKHLKVNYIGIVKTNHKGFPKVLFGTNNERWPAGSNLVLELEKDRMNILTIVGVSSILKCLQTKSKS